MMEDLQAAIDATPAEGGVVVVSAGETCVVDAVNNTIRLKDRVRLQIDGTIQALPAAQSHYTIISFNGAVDAAVIVNGQVLGEMDQHQGPASDDHGLGIAVLGAVRPTVCGSGTISKVAGDGVYIDQACKNVTLKDFTSRDNRRQAMSVIDVDGFDADAIKLLNSGNAPPSAGVDFEPDDPSRQSIRNVRMRNCTITGNAGASVLIACPPSARSNIDIDGSNKMDKHPIDGTDGIVPFWAKWYFYVFHSYALYPRSIKL